MVNEPSVFEPLKFDCTFWHDNSNQPGIPRSLISLRCPHENKLYILAIQNARSKVSYQTARMCRLIWIFEGRTCSRVRFGTLWLKSLWLIVIPFMNTVNGNISSLFFPWCMKGMCPTYSRYCYLHLWKISGRQHKFKPSLGLVIL